MNESDKSLIDAAFCPQCKAACVPFFQMNKHQRDWLVEEGEAMAASFIFCPHCALIFGGLYKEKARATLQAVNGLSKLSVRQQEVFQMIGEGHSNAEIAQKLSLADSTIVTHGVRIMAKLQLRDTFELLEVARHYCRMDVPAGLKT